MIDPDLNSVRNEYSDRTLPEPEPNPFTQFRQWFQQAQAANVPEANAMSLATSAGNKVTCRTVLLKAFDERGFVFFTNYKSRKALQIEANPNVALLFAWLPIARQIEICGVADKISAAESLAYFMNRPFGSRVGAWVSQQSKVIPSREFLRAKFNEMCQLFADGKVPMPEAWGGYRVQPASLEFWQGAASRLHDRLIYSKRDSAAWQIDRLAP